MSFTELYFRFVEKIRVRINLMLIKLFYNANHIIIASNNGAFLVIVLLFSWIFEWLFIFEDILSTNTYLNFYFPYRITMLLLLIFLFFINSWIISVWRRSLFGKFTRGDRELWLKGFSSFWFFELSTLLGFILAAAWMNWGPTPLFNRKFNISRQSFLFELVIFTYLVTLINLMRISVKLSGWKNQIIWVIITLLLLSTLIWRDILVLIGRDSITLSEGSRWKFVNSALVLYSLSPAMWSSLLISHKILDGELIDHSCYTLSQFLTLLDDNVMIDVFKEQSNYSLYNRYQSMTDLIETEDFCWIETVDVFFYPKRIGFFPKRISMWTLFLFLKIWHHLMLIIWWYYYLIRLYSTKKISNIFLAVCAFNTYCCFLIIFSIYIYCLFPKLVMFFRFFKDRPKMLNFQTFLNWKDYIFDYIYSILSSIHIDLNKTHNINSFSNFHDNVLTDILKKLQPSFKKKSANLNIKEIISYLSGL